MNFRFFALAAAMFLTLCHSSAASDKNVYLDLIETAVNAYSDQRIEDYVSRVDKEGIREHGYGRLTANLGILIAHGRMPERKALFERMMDICVREMPVAQQKNGHRGGTGNDFAVKEISCCIMELEASGVFPASKIEAWKCGLRDMKAADIYTKQPKLGRNQAENWCVYGSASECARIKAGIGGDRSYADRYFTDQLRFFDANGMFMDPHQPMVYDMVTRLQFMAALELGYDGPAREEIEKQLLKSAIPTIWMQSVSGEIPFGGRSNQFLHGETFLAAVFEYYASWMKRRGDMEAAARFKAAAARAVESLTYWTSRPEVRHIKNRYPIESGYGCEKYAYFDKYMVTMGSWAYLAYLFADDSIQPSTKEEKASTFVTTPKFHQIIMNAGGYTVQFDTDANPSYDSNGIGRFQRRGASPLVGLSSPCPSVSKPSYKLDIANPGPLAIAPLWEHYTLSSARSGKVVLTDGSATWTSRLGRRGLKMELKGNGEQMLTLPAFETDGETQSVITCDGRTLAISFGGWRCRYTAITGTIEDSGTTHANRNGHLRRFNAHANGKLVIRAVIERAE